MGSSSATENATAEVISKSGLSLGKQIETATKATSALSTKVSVRARTLNGEILKVNDKMGNPIEIANVVVWHVKDTAKALFDVDNYEQFVATQAETALRHVASIYAYDHAEDSSDSMDSITLRSNIEEVSTALKHELTPAPGTRRRGGGRRAPHAPCLRARNRPGDAPPASRRRP